MRINLTSLLRHSISSLSVADAKALMHRLAFVSHLEWFGFPGDNTARVGFLCTAAGPSIMTQAHVSAYFWSHLKFQCLASSSVGSLAPKPLNGLKFTISLSVKSLAVISLPTNPSDVFGPVVFPSSKVNRCQKGPCITGQVFRYHLGTFGAF